jgi:hypothetical protein
MSATPDSDPIAAGEEITPVALPDNSLRCHLYCSRRHQAWRQTERRYLLRRLRNVIVDLGRNKPAPRDFL